ncbi:MAG TPA: nuclease A inhibitor family protein [Pyrinomonadaceae bacterium]|jgi:hypothetical protein
MGENNQALLQQLRTLTKGLTFQSESDYPVEVFSQAANAQKTLSAQDLIAARNPKGAVSEIDFDSFFRNATQEQEGQTSEAQQTVKKFQTLVKTLKDNLSELKVYKVGETEADVYVVGKTASGNFAGVTTKVVET